MHPSSVSEEDINSLWIQNGCTIYRMNGHRYSHPGNLCVFLDDGSFISATGTFIRRFSQKKEILWEIPGHFHHQMNISPDKQRILVLSSDIVKREGRKERDDAFLILSIDGKILHRQNSFEHLQSLNQGSLGWKNQKQIAIAGGEIETTHFNSIYEIPANNSPLPYLKAGNVIVNSSALGVYILSPDLKKVVHFEKFQFSLSHQVHDVQVTASGEILLFNNIANKPDEVTYSAIQKYDPLTKKITLSVTANPLGIFYSPACGGAQEIGDYLYFSHIVTGGYLYSKTKKAMIATSPGTNGDILMMEPVQQLKLINAENFLKNSGEKPK